jgi:hypothetical protein
LGGAALLVDTPEAVGVLLVNADALLVNADALLVNADVLLVNADALLVDADALLVDAWVTDDGLCGNGS